MASSLTTSPAVRSGELTDLVSTSASATVYPTDDSILTVLQARFRSDQPYSRISTSNYVVVNPYKALANTNDVSAREYEERCYKDTNLQLPGTPSVQPHMYELAARIYLLMRRRNESQSVVFRGITGSGKSSSSRLVVEQILRMSAHSKREIKLAEQVKALTTLLDSFGNAKTLINPNASRHGRYLELHFNERGRIGSAKVLTYGLDKSRLNRLTHEERTYHVFYQFLAGATAEERDHFNLEDPSDYALLASSGCYRLPGGPFSDDSVAMDELRASMKTLGFKPKHISAIFTVLVAILLLGNIEFADGDARDVSAYVVNTPILEQVALLLGVPSEELAQILTNKTSYVRKELYTVLLNAEQSAAQRDSLVRDLYAILFAFVVETANHRIAPGPQDLPPSAQLVLLDQPGFQSRAPTGTNSMALTGAAPLISAYGQNGFDEFCINFQDELLHSYVLRQTFDDSVGYNGLITGDGVTLPDVKTMDNGACVELLRGIQLSEKVVKKPAGVLGVMNKASSSFRSGKSGDKKDEEMMQTLVSQFGVHASFVASPSMAGASERNLFGINHYAGGCSYDVSGFIEKDTDILDPAFVSLLRTSSEGFIVKLFSGPSMAAEKHYKDESIIVQAQVSSRPLRQPTPLRSREGQLLADDHSILDPTKVYPVTTQLNYNISELLRILDNTRSWTVSCIRPNDSGSPNSFDKRRVKSQIRSLLLPDIVARRRVEYTVEFEQTAFCDRYVPTMRGSEGERIRQCAQANGWHEGRDYVLGHRLICLAYPAWKMVEDVVRAAEKENRTASMDGAEEDDIGPDDATENTHLNAPSLVHNPFASSADNLVSQHQTGGSYSPSMQGGYGGGGLSTPITPGAHHYDDPEGSAWDSEWGDKKDRGAGEGATPPDIPHMSKEGNGLIVNQAPNAVEAVPSSRSRRMWLWVVRGCTWWIPTFLLSAVGRMKRPDIRLAWREKVTICLLIFFINALVIFYIIEFGRLLCPNFNKAWSANEVAEHTDDNNYWVSIQGWVYDVSDFVHGDHSDISGEASNGEDTLDALAGQDLTQYFPVPLSLACPGLVDDQTLTLTVKNDTVTITQAVHTSGSLQSAQNTKLDDADWYTSRFLPKIKQFRKGPLVVTKKKIAAEANDDDIAKVWAIYKDQIFDLTDYENTVTINSASSTYQFLDSDIVGVFKERAGQDITKPLDAVLKTKDSSTVQKNMDCLSNAFYVGKVDFRKSPRCQVQNYFLLAASGVLMASMLVKFLAALQLSPKRNPELQDKFVLCQIPCYTEGEESLRRTIDSLAALNYDDKRKLLFVICDGNIIGSGNDRTTPRIVLDILGVDPKLDPEPLLFKSIGEGSKAINYGKVYSGLYEFEGHVVPYMVVVKVGKPTERSKPGNRGKRDSQILLMHYLNRVHFDSPMSPLELEIYHQMRNVIGIDPAFYEYIFTVDADTTVTTESLNRLVASAADDSSIIGICGETRLENEEGSWWTMIQVYEYYISHNLSKAFESLFGSVTCLPGCFTLYRIRTADKGRPIIISNRVIDEYSEPNVDTLHKKNLFSLGEDRFLTTLLMKHFPTFKTKFIPDAIARTVAPESWRVLLSQRRRWINSTVHNLCELILLPELFGFCCFSMRFFVFLDLLGTLILPATVVYLIYLIVVVATGSAPLPIISIAMIAAVYGLQALVFILRREFMLVGWMVVYILSYPVYSFFLPVYSFWCMDEFGWGNTRLVIGEGKDKKVVLNDDEKYDESMIPLKKFSEYEAETWETVSHRSGESGYNSRSRSRPPASRSQSPLHPSSQSGDYYRDTNLVAQKTGVSNMSERLRKQGSNSNMSQYGAAQQMYGGVPQLPFMPFASGPGSAAGSDYGGHPMHMPPMGFQHTGGSMYGSMYGPGAPAMSQYAGSMYGAPQMPAVGQFGEMGGSQSGLGAPTMSMNQRPMSTFSMATTVNPFAGGPSMNPNPTDEELFTALRNYLSTQDLMTVTKKTAREAMTARFPNADLSTRKDFLNESIDKILSDA
ncbi:chitin synthase [Punctularia strigosozonata HHB-11173 SS5]|uniref:chitin synthase n=1 Tax=Punctularia strigosozonata (strain HHB-11173) TaxID=741275 RepID=UPI0004416F13|nr:chitin synthase [Punctularia strigosozonata HHB-11173 SS5]EIN11094.1 chitin synthase [Punctularia strigosozonata HHB-11173 SS5]